MALPLFFHPSVIRSDIPKLHPLVRLRIRRALRQRIALDPTGCGKALGGTMKGYRSFRVGDYRVTYDVAPDRIRILRIGHRSEVYHHTEKRLRG
ncbi:MAG: type II toxin-antitoxin system RelE/ParE family toxin [Armatimonadota bacterium]